MVVISGLIVEVGLLSREYGSSYSLMLLLLLVNSSSECNISSLGHNKSTLIAFMGRS